MDAFDKLLLKVCNKLLVLHWVKPDYTADSYSSYDSSSRKRKNRLLTVGERGRGEGSQQHMLECCGESRNTKSGAELHGMG